MLQLPNFFLGEITSQDSGLSDFSLHSASASLTACEKKYCRTRGCRFCRKNPWLRRTIFLRRWRQSDRRSSKRGAEQVCAASNSNSLSRSKSAANAEPAKATIMTNMNLLNIFISLFFQTEPNALFCFRARREKFFKSLRRRNIRRSAFPRFRRFSSFVAGNFVECGSQLAWRRPRRAPSPLFSKGIWGRRLR